MTVEVTDGLGNRLEKSHTITKSSEYEFALLMGYFIHKYCKGEAILDHADFHEFFEEEHSLERIDNDKDGISIYKVD